MMASRASRKFGFAGESFMPSVTSLRMSWLPIAKPCLTTMLARASHSAAHQTLPALWT